VNWKYLSWTILFKQLQYLTKNVSLSFYCNIFFLNIVCKNIVCDVCLKEKKFSISKSLAIFYMLRRIEGIKLEYGIIENCKIDTNLTSKIWRRVTSKKMTVTSNLASNYLTSTVKTGSNGVKRGHSIPYHHQ